MKNIKGLLLIFISVCITLVVWITAAVSLALPFMDSLRHVIAGLAMCGFFLMFVLAARFPFIERWFGGLDKLYVVHKFVAIGSLGLIAVHAALSGLLETVDSIRLTKVVGWVALVLFIAIIVLSLFDKYVKLLKQPFLDKLVNYENWRFTHRFSLLAYAFGLFHMYISSHFNLLQLTPLGIWQGVTGLIGLGLGTYVVFFYQKTQYKYSGRVSQVNRLTPSIVEWEITLDKPIRYSRGQFIFVKVFKPGIEEAPHPFSISGGDGRRIYLTTRVLGDFTKSIYDALEVGTTVRLNGPYGRMDFSAGRPDQIWIAGGIGITPFMAYLRDNTFTQKVEMFYSYTGPAGAAYKEYLEEYARTHENFSIHLIDSTQSKMLNLADYPLDGNKADIYMCGPQPMVNAFARYFRSHFGNPRITFEAFKLH